MSITIALLFGLSILLSITISAISGYLSHYLYHLRRRKKHGMTVTGKILDSGDEYIEFRFVITKHTRKRFMHLMRLKSASILEEFDVQDIIDIIWKYSGHPKVLYGKKEWRGLLHCLSKPPPANWDIDVIYDPSNPENACIHGYSLISSSRRAVYATIFLVALYFSMIWLVFAYARQKQMTMALISGCITVIAFYVSYRARRNHINSSIRSSCILVPLCRINGGG